MEFQEFLRYTAVEDKHLPYLEELKQFVAQTKFLPKYHLYPKCGLMNDPNGLSYYNGKYQYFYQWFPFEPNHGMKHWGLATSSDLTHWQEEGFALVPNEEYERNGCYSGNAFEKDGQLFLYYTANYKTEAGKIPKQALAVMEEDGTIQKYANNPIIDGAPAGMSGEIRDPFVFQRGADYWMLLGGKTTDEVGALLLYKSSDLFQWSYEGVIEVDFPTGYMLECPSLIEVDGKDVLLISPMGYEKAEDRYHNQFASIYAVGHLDLEKRTFTTEVLDEIDAGFDFYAPQAFYGKEQKPLMVGWFGCGEQELPTDQDMWRHGLTLTRQLSLTEKGQLRQFVAAETIACFGPAQEITTSEVTTQDNYYHLQVTVPKTKATETLRFGAEDDFWQIIVAENAEKITVDRQSLALKVTPEDGETRSTRLEASEEVTFDIFVDNSFVEIYVNGGQKVFSIRVFNLDKKDHKITLPKTAKATIKYYK